MAIDIRTKQFGRHFSHIEADVRPLSVQERRQRRTAQFAETLFQRTCRVASSAGKTIARFGFAGLRGAANCLLRERAIGVSGLPDPASACEHPEGLCGSITDATPEGLIEGYARGLQGHALFGRLTWWSPRVAFATPPQDFVTSPGAQEKIRGGLLRFSLDRDYDCVLKACAAAENMPPRLMHLFAGLHDMGFAHCVEVRSAFGARVAGAWGLALGRVFITLGAFGAELAERDAALTMLNRHLAQQGFALNAALPAIGEARLGFSPMQREDYFAALIANSGYGRLGRWQLHAGVTEDERLAA